MKEKNARIDIDASIIAAVIKFMSAEFVSTCPVLQHDIERISNEYDFKPESKNTNAEFQNALFEKLSEFENTKSPDMKTVFYMRRFYNIAI